MKNKWTLTDKIYKGFQVFILGYYFLVLFEVLPKPEGHVLTDLLLANLAFALYFEAINHE